MSSFIIDKEEYAKAAGLVAGIMEFKGTFLYDYQKSRRATAADIYDTFTACYEMNKLSVIEQYDDTEMAGPEPTDKATADIFYQYLRKAKNNCMAPDKLKEMIMQLRSFFQCSKYQTENQGYFWKMEMIYNRILVAFMPYLHTESDNWGTIEI